MQQTKKFTIRRSTVMQKQKIETIPQKPVCKIPQQSPVQQTQLENTSNLLTKDEQKKLLNENEQLRQQLKDKCQEYDTAAIALPILRFIYNYIRQLSLRMHTNSTKNQLICYKKISNMSEKQSLISKGFSKIKANFSTIIQFLFFSQLNKQLERELKKREEEIDYFISKIDNKDKEIKHQKDLILKLKGKKKDYKKKCQEIQSQHQQHQHDPFQQLLEMRALLLQLRMTAQVLPLLQQQQRLRQYQTQAIDVDNMSYEQLLQLEDQMGNVSNGIAREDIRRIRKRVIQQSDNIQGVCPVCQCNMEIGERYRKLGCNHYYHSKCIKSWLLQHNNCPVCKQTVVIAI